MLCDDQAYRAMDLLIEHTTWSMTRSPARSPVATASDDVGRMAAATSTATASGGWLASLPCSAPKPRTAKQCDPAAEARSPAASSRVWLVEAIHGMTRRVPRRIYMLLVGSWWEWHRSAWNSVPSLYARSTSLTLA